VAKRILILSVSAGTGHLRAAEALEKVFRQQPAVSEVRNVDALQFTNKLFRDFYSKLYTQLVEKAPSFLGWWYKMSDEPWKTDKMRHMLDRLNTAPLLKFIADYNPDITVSTHFLPAELMSYLIASEKLQAQHSIVVTDFDFHAMWLSRLFHRYFVALEETKVHLEHLGLPAERITVSGIPIDPIFSESFSQTAVRRELGLNPDLPVLLISAGALGVSPAEVVLDQLMYDHEPMQLIVVCGRNDELRQNLETKVQAHPKVASRVTLLGYTKEMHRYMAAADLFIGKPGGLTTSEALAIGLPMVIVSPIPGQEERNSDHLLENGIAIKCNEFTTLGYKVRQLLSNPARLEQMRANAKAYARPKAAETVVRTLLHDDFCQTRPIQFDIEKQKEIAEAAKAAKYSSS
jgi:processive 1,2-diacylglycerol beta-glucosyltransferase